jgi:apolipoprotein N-acyltransferase
MMHMKSSIQQGKQNSLHKAAGFGLMLLSIPCLVMAFPPKDISILAPVALALYLSGSILFGNMFLAAVMGLVVLLGTTLGITGLPIATPGAVHILLFLACLGLAVGVTGASACWAVKHRYQPLFAWLTVAFSGVLAERLCSVILPVSLSVTQHNNPIALSIAGYAGSSGITLLIWLAASGIVFAFTTRSKALTILAALCTAVLILPIANIAKDPGASIRLAAIQGRYTRDSYNVTMRLRGTGWFVAWPEHLMDSSNNSPVRVAVNKHSYVAYDYSEKVPAGKRYNAAGLVSPSGVHILRTRKEHPFMQETLKHRRGKAHPPVSVPGGFKVAIPICYDMLYPNTVRRLVNQGAELLLVPNCDPDSPGLSPNVCTGQ